MIVIRNLLRAFLDNERFPFALKLLQLTSEKGVRKNYVRKNKYEIYIVFPLT